MITELVKFNLIAGAADEQLISKSDLLINGFMKKQDGFINAELVKEIDKEEWIFIYHFENFEKLKGVGEAMRKSNEFAEFIALVSPGSLSVTFYNQLMKWQLPY